MQEEDDPELYRKYQEEHIQKAYTLDDMIKCIEDAGLAYVTAYDAYTKERPDETSERITIVAKERGKGSCHEAENILE